MKNPLLKSSHHSGLTMVEISVSLAIVGVGLLAIIGVLPAIMAVSRSAVESSECALAAQNHFEYEFGTLMEPADIYPDHTVTDSQPYTSTTNVARPSFKAGVLINYVVCSNANGDSFFVNSADTPPANIKVSPTGTTLDTQRLLTRKIVTYYFPRPAVFPPSPGTATRYQTYSFCTEIAATSNIVLRP